MKKQNSMSNPIDDILMLPVDERIKAAEIIWESISDESASPSLTETQIEELIARRKAYEEGRMKFLSWEQVKENIQNRKR
ncbi:MAG: addiction module protein [Chitinophagales bacterium]|nr:addiction module protein [Chitinophagales bacterium]